MQDVRDVSGPVQLLFRRPHEVVQREGESHVPPLAVGVYHLHVAGDLAVGLAVQEVDLPHDVHDLAAGHRDGIAGDVERECFADRFWKVLGEPDVPGTEDALPLALRFAAGAGGPLGVRLYPRILLVEGEDILQGASLLDLEGVWNNDGEQVVPGELMGDPDRTVGEPYRGDIRLGRVLRHYPLGEPEGVVDLWGSGTRPRPAVRRRLGDLLYPGVEDVEVELPSVDGEPLLVELLHRLVLAVSVYLEFLNLLEELVGVQCESRPLEALADGLQRILLAEGFDRERFELDPEAGPEPNSVLCQN